MKIAFVSTILGYPWGGADTLWTRAAEAASARGDQLFLSVSTAVARHQRITTLTTAGAGMFLRDPPPFPPPFRNRMLRKLGLARSPDDGLITAVQSFRPDLVIFSHGGSYDLVLHPTLVAWLRASGTRYRVIANWQEEYPQLDDANLAFIRDTFAAADRLYFVSTRNLAVTRRHLALPLAQSQVIQNPLRWQPADVTPWPAGPVVRLATVSRLDEGKGIHLLLQALARSGATLPDWQLNIYGQGPYEVPLRAIAAQPGLREHVVFRGYVDELRAIWANNHLMVSPALEDGVPMTIPEAMLCQRPVLATCVGGAEDWLQHGTTGFLCPVPTVDELTRTLQTALAARERWATIGRTAAQAAGARYQPGDYLQLLAP